MLIGGWKTRSIFERFNIKNEDDLRDAAAMVAEKRIGKNWEKQGKIPPLKASVGSRNARSVFELTAGGANRTLTGSHPPGGF